MGLEGVNNKTKPNKSGSKGKQTLRPTSGPVLTQNKEANKRVMGLSEGMWKRVVTRSPCTNANPRLDVEISSKRKSESLNREIVEVITHEKKKKMDTEKDYSETAEVARQSRRDQGVS